MRLHLQLALNPEVKVAVGASYAINFLVFTVCDRRYKSTLLLDIHLSLFEKIHLKVVDLNRWLEPLEAKQRVAEVDGLGYGV